MRNTVFQDLWFYQVWPSNKQKCSCFSTIPEKTTQTILCIKMLTDNNIEHNSMISSRQITFL